MNFRAYARTAADDQHGEPYLEHGPDEGLFEPEACSYCGGSEFEAQEDNGRVQRATCAACGGTMVSHGGQWMPDLIGSPHNHPSDKPDPASGGVPGAGAAPEQVRDNDLSKRTAMPSRRHAPPEGLHFETYDAPEGSHHHEEAEESHPGWSHHLIRAHDPGFESGFPHMPNYSGMIYYSKTPEGAQHPGLAIHDMRVTPAQRGKGIASAMQDELRHQHPQHMIDHGSRTPSGEGWHSQYQDPGDPKLDLDHPDNVHEWKKYRPTELADDLAHKDLTHHGATDWCRHRHAEHCWLPRNDSAHPAVALYTPQDRGVCPWTTASMQQINCPMSEPGPMAGMSRAAAWSDPEFAGNVTSHADPSRWQRFIAACSGTMAREGGQDAGRLPDLDGDSWRPPAQGVVGGRGQRAAVRPGLAGGDGPEAAEGLAAAPHLRAAALHRGDAPEADDDRGAQPDAPRPADGLQAQGASVHAGEHPDDQDGSGVQGLRQGEGALAAEALASSIAAGGSELKWHVLAAWRDVRAKARRIRTEGGVSIVSALADGITGHVNGDTGVYETQINYVPGTFKIGYWQCGCAWASYSWGRSPAFRRFEGRMCSHALALQYEAQSRGMFGRQVAEDTTRPGWMRDEVRVRHDRSTRDHDVRAASRQDPLDPEGVYPTDHGLDLARSPIHAFAVEAYSHRGDPADVMRVLLAAGIEHADARRLLDATLHQRAVMEVEVQPQDLVDLGANLEKRAYYEDEDEEGHGDEHDGGQDWDDIHSGIEEMHRGVGVMLHPHDHAIVHDKSRPVEERAHHLLSVMQRHPSESGIGTHWTTEHRVADDFADSSQTRQLSSRSKTEHMQRGDHRWGTDSDGDPKGQPATSVMFHSHPPERHEIDDHPDEMAHGSSSIYGYHDHGEREVPIRPGGNVALKGISWKEKHDDFDEPDDHDDSYTHHAFGGEGRHVTAAAKDAPAEPTHAGVVLKAADTGRILMIQRSHQDETDPAAGTWEFPGGGREPGDHTSLHSGIREFEEEVGQEFPAGGHVSHVWQSPNGVYQGHVVVVPDESCVDFSGGRRTVNPDDPDGDDHEQSTWWDPDHARKNPALRPECRSSPWSMIKAASLPGVTADYSSDGSLGELQPDYRPKAPPVPPDATQAQNPGSTGFATSQDPPEWENASQRAETMSLSPAFAAAVAELHQEPEPALPSTTADDEDDSLEYGAGTPGERFRSQMVSEIPATESLSPSDGRTASTGGVSEIVERFQATAAAQALQSTGGPQAMDIASAARDHLAKAGGGGIQRTALKDFTSAEQMELIGEGRGATARNFADLKIQGTHYEALSEAMAHEQSLVDPDELFD
jgi:8-oxo-dGTP pyrophosphatase MutT (NUDIX family)